ncbi:MAG TPA: serine/threonine-protein kinase, partial [Polyangia bacterium]
GGAGNVFLAAHERIPGRVAVKTLRGERMADEQSLARFRVEAEITAGLRHPHIVQILDFDVTPSGLPYLVMELVEGGDLRALVAAGQCPLPRVAHIVRQIASALEMAHNAGIVHRDLKPANIMLVNAPGTPDFVKIVDFGLSKLLASDGPPVTRPDQILGTPGYMAPEQIRGRNIDARVDQFALASLTYELLAGRPPFPGEDLPSILHAIMSEDPPLLSSLVSWPCEKLSHVLARGLAKLPENRFPGVADFERAMSEAMVKDLAEATTLKEGDSSAAAAAIDLHRLDPHKTPTPQQLAARQQKENQPAQAGKDSLDGELEVMADVGRNYRW